MGLTTTAYDDQLVFPEKLSLRVQRQSGFKGEGRKGEGRDRARRDGWSLLGRTLDMAEERNRVVKTLRVSIYWKRRLFTMSDDVGATGGDDHRR